MGSDQIDPPATVDVESVWTVRSEPPTLVVTLVSVQVGDDTWQQPVVALNEGCIGAIVVACAGSSVAVVRQFRPAVNAWMWELPRGFGDPGDDDEVATALRELREETGYDQTAGVLLGHVYANTGLERDATAVVRVDVGQQRPQWRSNGETIQVKWLTEAELDFVRNFCEDKGCEFALSDVWGQGGKGGEELAGKVVKTVEEKESGFKPLYALNLPVKEKIETIAKEIYGASDVTYEAAAEKEIIRLEALGFGNLPICMAKNQYSLSDDPKKLGCPKDFTVNIREIYVSAGAGFVVAITGTVMTMPGLPKKPAAEGIDVENGVITGLF